MVQSTVFLLRLSLPILFILGMTKMTLKVPLNLTECETSTWL